MTGPAPSPDEVRVLDGGEPVEVVGLARVRLPDGRPGAVWRGQAFPLAADGSIDIAGPYATPAECTPLGPPSTGWSLLEGEEECALLLRGGVLERDRALAALRAAGIAALRSAPALDAELAADWVVRIPRPKGPPALSERIAALLGSPAEEAPAEPSDLRLRLLEARIAGLVAERDRLRRELEAARNERSAGRRPADAPLEAELALARERIARLEQELASLPRGPAPPPATASRGSERSLQRLRAEVEDLVAAFPRLRLVGDSLLTMVTDYRDRKAVYRTLAELDRGDPARRFKPVRGREGWLECHVGTGQDDSGRVYAARAADGAWLVLVSVKEQQRRDIERLRELARRAEP